MTARSGGWLRTVARVAVAVGLTGYLLWKSHPQDVLTAAAGADWRPIAFSILLVLVDRSLMAYRWLLLLCIVEPERRPPLGAIMRIFFTSTFVGTFLPASVGGEAVRAYSLARLHVGGGDAVASVFMDRILGVASVLVMAIVGLALARDLAGNITILASLGVAGAIVLVTLLLIFSARATTLASALLRYLPAALHKPGEAILAALRRYAAYHPQLVNVLLCSVLVQVLRIIQAYYLGRGLGIAVGPTAYFAFVPLILLVMYLPITFNGIGTSQAAFVWFFARVGVAAAPAFALSVLFVALGIIGNLPGGLLYATGHHRARSEAGA